MASEKRTKKAFFQAHGCKLRCLDNVSLLGIALLGSHLDIKTKAKVFEIYSRLSAQGKRILNHAEISKELNISEQSVL